MKSVRTIAYGLLAMLILVTSLAAAGPANAGNGIFCSNASVAPSYDGASLAIAWRGNARVTGAWLIVPNGIAGKAESLGNAYAFIPVSGAGTRAMPGGQVLSHSGSASTAALKAGTQYTHVQLLVRTSLGYCKTPVNNFMFAKN